ncbi:MAG TPA: glycogen debranching protein GlgX [Longimicrobium sp.]
MYFDAPDPPHRDDPPPPDPRDESPHPAPADPHALAPGEHGDAFVGEPGASALPAPLATAEADEAPADEPDGWTADEGDAAGQALADAEQAAEAGDEAGEEAHIRHARVPSPYEPATTHEQTRSDLFVPGLLDRARTAWPGRPFPLGATWDGKGVNFALYSEQAVDVLLCVFASPSDSEPVQAFRLRERTAYVWHGYVPDLPPGTFYGYRVNGTYDPGRGLRCTPFKLLVDPYARALAGQVRYEYHPFAYLFDQPGQDWVLDDEDDAAGVPKGVVLADDFDWGDDAPPGVPWHETLIYEAHVKGLTMLHPEVPPEIRGTYAAVAHPAVIRHLRSLGVTAVELLPVHEIVDELFLVRKGLRNYWGYNTLNFFAPAGRYASVRDYGGQVREFKEMVRALHAAGIEVILDVVYNHTAEGNHLGPTLSFRGIDNPTYYRLVPGDPRRYMDFTGTGNSFNLRHPQTLQLVMDSLRYWVQEMHVDGFRFDLASTLARELHAVERLSSFFDVIHQDPVLSRVKLIAEPWDVGEGGYQVGNFPVLWAEWNGKYRDTVRAYWRGDAGALGELGYRLTGSSDLYENDGRKPHASINFVTCHDGFTLRDLVSYSEKHNLANGEENRDGDSHNRSWNHGVEGLTDDAEIDELRRRQRRNFVTTLLLSQGVPMLLGGDELGRTQHGNNNAYCQDNEVSWYDWEHEDEELRDWFSRVVAYRAAHPVFRRRRWFQGRQIRGIEDMAWFRPDAGEMSDDDWEMGFAKSVGVFMNGDTIQTTDMFGGRIVDDSFMIVFNAGADPLPWKLPNVRWGARWVVDLDTADPLAGTSERSTVAFAPNAKFTVPARSMLVLRRTEAVAKHKHPSARRRKPPP